MRTGWAAAALVVLCTAGCGDLLQSKETRQRIDAVKAAVRRNPGRIDAPYENGQPPLHGAVIDRYHSLQAWLLDHGANPNAPNARGETALHLAVLGDRTPEQRTLRFLIRRGADPNAAGGDGSTPLHVAAAFGSAAALHSLLEGGGDPRRRSHRGDTPLHGAATPQPDRSPEDCRRMIAELVRRGADPNARNASGMAPLHQAALFGNVVVLRALLEAGARADLEGPGGVTAQSIAATAHHAAAADLLRQAGPPVQHVSP